MTHLSIPQALAGGQKLPRRRFEVVSNAMLQRLLRDLRRYEREANRALVRAQRVRKQLESTNVDVPGAGKRISLNALWEAFYLPDHLAESRGRLRRWIMEIAGTKSEYDTDLRLRGLTPDDVVEPEQQCTLVDPKPAPPPQDALAQALQIVTAAHDENLQIDWTENPATDRERELRLAIIRRIEKENADFDELFRDVWPKGFRLAPAKTLKELGTLAPHDAPEIGEDIYDAIERWRGEADEQSARNEAARQKDFIDAARRELEGGGGK